MILRAGQKGPQTIDTGWRLGMFKNWGGGTSIFECFLFLFLGVFMVQRPTDIYATRVEPKYMWVAGTFACFSCQFTCVIFTV